MITLKGRNQIILNLSQDEFNTIMLQLYYPATHIAGFDDEIIEDLYKEARSLYKKLDKAYMSINME